MQDFPTGLTIFPANHWLSAATIKFRSALPVTALFGASSADFYASACRRRNAVFNFDTFNAFSTSNFAALQSLDVLISGVAPAQFCQVNGQPNLFNGALLAWWKGGGALVEFAQDAASNTFGTMLGLSVTSASCGSVRTVPLWLVFGAFRGRHRLLCG